MRLLLKGLLLSFLPFYSFSQELLCEVTVNAPTNFRTSYTNHKELESTIRDFVNNTRWTDRDVTEKNEKIQCSFILDILDYKDNHFNVSMNVKGFRPVYNSIYESQVSNFIENISFNFEPNTILNYVPFSINTPLVSILSFYSLLIVGFDYDSFTELGGTPYFNQAEQVFNTCISAGHKGWERSNDDKKFRLIQELRYPYFQSFRQGYYAYHRLGLDILQKDPESGYKSVTGIINIMEDIFKTDRNAYLISFFFYTKFSEIFNLVLNPNVQESRKLISAIKKISPYYYGKWKINQELEKSRKR